MLQAPAPGTHSLTQAMVRTMQTSTNASKEFRRFCEQLNAKPLGEATANDRLAMEGANHYKNDRTLAEIGRTIPQS